MVKLSVADATAQIFKTLEGFEPDEKTRIIDAVVTLTGGEPTSKQQVGGHERPGQPPLANHSTVKQFFDLKAPNSKIEELAVAARYRELHESADAHEKDDFKRVIGLARRNFDSKHYKRDMSNAKVAGLFNKGGGNPLAYYGQNYVDALPDREAVKQLKKPKRAGKKAKKRAARTV